MERDSERKFELHRCLSILVSPPMEYQRRQLTPCGDGACLWNFHNWRQPPSILLFRNTKRGWILIPLLIDSSILAAR